MYYMVEFNFVNAMRDVGPFRMIACLRPTENNNDEKIKQRLAALAAKKHFTTADKIIINKFNYIGNMVEIEFAHE